MGTWGIANNLDIHRVAKDGCAMCCIWHRCPWDAGRTRQGHIVAPGRVRARRTADLGLPGERRFARDGGEPRYIAVPAKVLSFGAERPPSADPLTEESIRRRTATPPSPTRLGWVLPADASTTGPTERSGTGTAVIHVRIGSCSARPACGPPTRVAVVSRAGKAPAVSWARHGRPKLAILTQR